jgi:DNA adenine methylase
MRLLESNGLRNVEYVEPYAGGASLALALLLEEYASTIHINDLSRPVYAFWYSVLNDTTNLCRKIESVEVTMAEWHQQQAVYNQRDTATLEDLGFATLFLNRTNRSGIIGGGVIGGKNQTGKWRLNARFNKSELIRRIKQIGRYKSRIKLYQLDALELTKQLLPQMEPRKIFVFYDPPYIEKGEGLYLNDYELEDHQRLAERIVQLDSPWVVTYDYDAAIRHRLYGTHRRLVYELPYSAQTRYGGKEVMFLSGRLKLPDTWSLSAPILMAAPHSEHPLYGKLEE